MDGASRLPNRNRRRRPRATEALAAFGRWTQANGRAIYGCREAPPEFAAPKGAVLTWNPATRRLYAILTEWPMGRLRFDFGDKVEYAPRARPCSGMSSTR